ncbi:flagellar hook assembly protein [Carnobacterium mobile]|uniref:flagellar hook assembly protein n=1 Tax=Carnobacterium mobile TaxID=2750 RepID=UPI0006925F8D|nr:flagellar hook assembly protein [Carnobacterium mobile]
MDIPANFNIGSVNSIKDTQKKTNELSTDDFLQIMAATVKMPSMPGEGSGGSGGGETDYLAQMAQFNMMDQLTNISEKMNTELLINQQQQALGLLGKEVKVTDESSFVTGPVEKVRFDKGYATIRVNGKDFYLNDILEVSNQA